MALITDYLLPVYAAAGFKLEAKETPLLPVNPSINTYGYRSVGFVAGQPLAGGAWSGASFVPAANDPARANAEILWIRQMKRDLSTPFGWAGAYLRGTGTAGAENFYNLLGAENAPPSRYVQFDGVDDEIDIPANTPLNIATNLTVEFWATPDITTNNAGLFEKTIGGAVNTAYLVFFEGGSLKFRLMRASDSALQTLAYALPAGFLGAEHHVAATFESSSGNMVLYVDGLQVGVPLNIGAGAVIATGTGTSKIGRLHPAAATYLFKGLMRDVRVWNVTRSAAEISAFRNTVLSGKETGLAGLWRLDDTSNYGEGVTVAVDRSSTPASGTLTNGALRVTDANAVTISLQKRVAGVTTALDYFPLQLVGTDLQDVYLRFRADGTTIYAKAWRADQPEPAAWGAIVTDSSVAGAGSLGFIHAMNVPGNTPDFALPGFISVGTNGETAPKPRTDLEQHLWMNDDAPRVVISEAQVLGQDINQNAVPLVALMSNHGFTTQASDVPANQVYDDIIVKAPTFSSSAPDAPGGRYSQSVGDMVVKNDNGTRDHWLTWSWDGRRVDFYMGGIGWRKWDFIKVASSVTAKIYAPARDQIGFKFGDLSELLNRKVQDVMIGGTSTNAGMPKPIAFGKVFNVEAVLIDAATLRYKIHDESLFGATGITQVRDSGVSVAFTDQGGGEFTLNAAPTGNGRITADLTVDSSVSNWVQYPEDISKWQTLQGVSKVVAGAYAAGDGRKVLGNVVVDNANSAHQVITNTFTKGATVVPVSFEIDLVPAGYNFARLVVANSAVTGFVFADVNLLTGAVSGATNNGTYTGAAVSSTLLANGVVRVKLSCNTDADTGVRGQVQIANTLGNTTFLGDGVSGVAMGRGQIYPGTVTVQYGPGLSNTAAGAAKAGIRHAALLQTIVEQRSGLGEGACYQGARPGSLATFASTTAPIGLYLKDEANYLDVLDTVAGSAGGFWYFNRLGLFCATQFRVPSAPYDHVLNEDDVSGFKIEQLFVPSDPQQLGYQKNNTVQKDGFAGSVSVANRALYMADAQYTISIPTYTGLDRPSNHLSRTRPRNRVTLNYNAADASDEVFRLDALWRKTCAMVSFDTKVNVLDYNLGQVVFLTYPRLGFRYGKAGLIVGLDEDPANTKVTVRMLVQLDGQFPVQGSDGYVPVSEFYRAAVY